jgi:ParB family transcriptional regulator, chromosome partitioning protein
MADEQQRPARLGRGLAALLGDGAEDTVAPAMRGQQQRMMSIDQIRPNRLNPRKAFDETALDELAASIAEKGVIQPIVVRPILGANDAYEIIAGERRWRAAQKASRFSVPVVVMEAADRDVLELAIIENVQREDLNALEEAAGYEQLMAQFGYVQADLAKVVGKSRSHVANTLRLNRLPDGVKAHMLSGALSAGHARALLTVADPEKLANRIVAEGMTVRDVEKISQDEDRPRDAQARPRREKDADTRALEQALVDVLGMDVKIDHKGAGGTLTIRYASLEQLDALCRRLKD